MNATNTTEGELVPLRDAEMKIGAFPTMEECQARLARVKSVRERFPEVAKGEKIRGKWSKVYSRKQRLEVLLARAQKEQGKLWEEMNAAKAALPQEAKEAFEL